jgi:hypothetical protein
MLGQRFRMGLASAGWGTAHAFQRELIGSRVWDGAASAEWGMLGQRFRMGLASAGWGMLRLMPEVMF